MFYRIIYCYLDREGGVLYLKFYIKFMSFDRFDKFGVDEIKFIIYFNERFDFVRKGYLEIDS